MALQGLEIRRSSATLRGGGTGLRKMPTVAKYIDTTICIGCKACEVACREWNDLPLARTEQTGRYQTLPTLAANYWNPIQVREIDTKADGLSWLMRKGQCMHCDEPGCLEACPAPGAIIQYVNGIVDVDPEVHRLRPLRDRLPLRRAPLRASHEQDGEVHPLRGSRLGGPGAGPH